MHEPYTMGHTLRFEKNERQNQGFIVAYFHTTVLTVLNGPGESFPNKFQNENSM